MFGLFPSWTLLPFVTRPQQQMNRWINIYLKSESLGVGSEFWRIWEKTTSLTAMKTCWTKENKPPLGLTVICPCVVYRCFKNNSELKKSWHVIKLTVTVKCCRIEPVYSSQELLLKLKSACILRHREVCWIMHLIPGLYKTGGGNVRLKLDFVFAVSGNEDCLWYVDKNGTWHNGFDCPLITFCCGNCHRRYCCLDAFKMITEREQKRCMLFQFRWGHRRRQGCSLIN